MPKQTFIRIAWIFKFPREKTALSKTETPSLKENLSSVLQEARTTVINEELPEWAQNPALRRNLAYSLILALLGIWGVSIAVSSISLLNYLFIGAVWFSLFGVLNFTFRSLFDMDKDELDERLLEMRSSTYEPSYYIAGLLIFVIYLLSLRELATLNEILFAVITTYISIPYILLALREKTLL